MNLLSLESSALLRTTCACPRSRRLFFNSSPNLLMLQPRPPLSRTGRIGEGACSTSSRLEVPSNSVPSLGRTTAVDGDDGAQLGGFFRQMSGGRSGGFPEEGLRLLRRTMALRGMSGAELRDAVTAHPTLWEIWTEEAED